MNQDVTLQDNLSVEEHVMNALDSMLLQYKDRKKGLRILSKKMGIHEKTLNRLINQENKASYQTVFKIFRVYLNEYNDSKLLEIVPEKIREFLLKFNAQVVTPDKTFTSNADEELQKNPVVAELYVLAATGPISLEEVEFRFGKYGVELLFRMIDKKLLTEAHKGIYILGSNQAQFNGETIVSVGKVLIEAHAKPQNGEELNKNFISFYAESLNDEAYKKWLEIDQEAFRKKFELSRDSRNLGQIRAFTFMITETIQLKDIQ